MNRSRLVLGVAVVAMLAAWSVPRPALSGSPEGDKTRYIVASTLDKDNPHDSTKPWVGTVHPMIRHVDPGADLVLVNLSYEKVLFTFKGDLFENAHGTAFWVEPEQVKVLRVKADLKIGPNDERRFYSVTSEKAFKDLPGPRIFVP